MLFTKPTGRPLKIQRCKPHFLSNTGRKTLAPLEALGVLEFLTGEHKLTSDITAIATPGHSLGTMSLTIVSGKSER
jgi:hypothetical protein